MDSANGTVIVALPSVGDPVWKLSSEEKPHLTMLFLGETTPEENLHIAQFLEHLTTVGALHRFGLSVDKRDTLGDKNADVLFFRGAWDAKAVKQARGYMLADDTINKLFNGAPQFEGWTPHLTVGYPQTPAHDDALDYPINWVNFDKLALWTGNYEGEEFDLNDQWSESEDMAMSALAVGEQAVDDLFHYGIKGMRWGVRKADHEGGTMAKKTKVPPSEDKLAVNQAAAKVRRGNTDALSNKELQALVQRMNLEQQYSRLSSGDSRLAAGNKKAKQVLDAVDTGKKIYSLTPTPVKSRIGKALRRTAISAAVLAGRAAARRGK